MSEARPPELEALLRAAREDVPSSHVLRQLRARIDTTSGGGGDGGAAPSAPQSSVTAGTVVIRAGLALVVAGAIGVVLYAARDSDAGPESRSAPPSATHPTEAPAPAHTPEPATSPAVEHALHDADDHARTEDAPRTRAPRELTPSVRPPTRDAPSEAELVTLARRQGTSDPRTALTTLARHRALYRDGVLAEERDALEIEALATLGRASASRRARAFLARYPSSVHRERVERAIEAIHGGSR